MSVYFIGCAHLGHRNIAKFRPFVKSCQDNIDLIKGQWEKRITKRDIVYVMGDAAFDDVSNDLIGNLPGRKILIKGNHDDIVSTARQAAVYEEIYAMLRYKGMWLTHAPIHPAEMRGRKCNVHAHVHNATIMKGWGPWRRPDPKYINTCVDVTYKANGSVFMTLDEIKGRVD